MLKALVLIDNIADEDLVGEWGLSIGVNWEEQSYLLDMGASDTFIRNAEALGFDISSVNMGVLSHGHYDHANGMLAFFEKNSHGKCYVRTGAQQAYYHKELFIRRYIGIPHELTTGEYSKRIEYVEGDYELAPGVWLIPHKTEGLAAVGKRNHMYRKQGRKWIPDDFSHEQSLVFDTLEGLVIFNSCSHGGADHIIKEVSSTFPGKKIKAMIGGFHLFLSSEKEIRQLAKGILETGVEQIYTGHCTGQRAYSILKEELGDKLFQLKVGLEINL